MSPSNTSTAPASRRKRPARKSSAAVLATCPVNGAGWCPYPFSPAQLEKRMKAKQAEEQRKLEANNK